MARRRRKANILAPTDAHVNCQTGAITLGVPLERIMQAAKPAPGEAADHRCLPRQSAGHGRSLSEPEGQDAILHPASRRARCKAFCSPFATVLFAALEANPKVYFEQVMNEVARVTNEAAQK